MNKFYIYLIWLGFFVTDQAQWYNYNPLPPTSLDLKFVSPSVGWVVGTSGIILKTTTGGNTWFSQNSGTNAALESAYFFNALHGIVVGVAGTIIQTYDGGETWISMPSGTGNILYSVFFINENIGFAVGGGGTVIKTTDGGLSWQTKSQGVYSSLHSVWFINENTGFAVTDGMIIKTSDGGDNWNIVWQDPVWHFYYSIAFANDTLGIVAGDKIVKTTDGGSTWAFSQPFNFTDSFFDLFCINENTWTAVGYPGIYRSTDGGNTWFSQYSTYYPPLHTVAFTNINCGIALGTNQLFLKTTNGGNYWQYETATYTDKNLNSVSYIASCAVGDSGIIMKLTDGTWRSIFSETSNDLHDICMSTQLHGIVVGDSGTILTTIDGGNSWQIQESGITNCLNGVSSINDENHFLAIAVGDDGTIIKSHDEGISWMEVDPGVTEDLFSVFITDSNTCFICGDNGKILKSENNGLSWTLLQSGTTSKLFSISFDPGNELIGEVSGEVGTILKTIDGGNSWNPQDCNIPTQLNEVYIYNENIAYIVANNGNILKTMNGGNSWHPEQCFTSNSIFSVSVAPSNPNLAFAVGEDGLILKTTNGGGFVPVELISFSGYSKDGSIYLSWTTASENNNYGFEIQRKYKSSWASIGFIHGMGTSTEINKYNFCDKIINKTDQLFIAYRLKQIDYEGTFKYSEEINIPFAPEYTLYQNYPNPFNPITKIKYQLPELSKVKLTVYDVLGRKIKTLVNEEKSAGSYEIEFNGTGLPSGVYFYRIESGKFSDTKKLILIK